MLNSFVRTHVMLNSFLWYSLYLLSCFLIIFTHSPLYLFSQYPYDFYEAGLRVAVTFLLG